MGEVFFSQDLRRTVGPRVLVSLLMSSPAAQPLSRRVIICLVLLAFIWFLAVRYRQDAAAFVVSPISIISGEYDAMPQEEEPSSHPISRDQFIDQFVKTPFQEFDPRAIQQECASTEWHDDIVFRCDQLIGGVGNIRQEILTCMHWAIKVGAALVRPGIQSRLQTNASEGIVHKYDEGEKDLGVFFNRELYLNRLHEACPQMRVYENVDAIGPRNKVQLIGKLEVNRMLRTHGVNSWDAPEGKIGPWTLEWINERKAKPGNITLVNYGYTFCH